MYRLFLLLKGKKKKIHRTFFFDSIKFLETKNFKKLKKKKYKLYEESRAAILIRLEVIVLFFLLGFVSLLRIQTLLRNYTLNESFDPFDINHQSSQFIHRGERIQTKIITRENASYSFKRISSLKFINLSIFTKYSYCFSHVISSFIYRGGIRTNRFKDHKRRIVSQQRDA